VRGSKSVATSRLLVIRFLFVLIDQEADKPDHHEQPTDNEPPRLKKAHNRRSFLATKKDQNPPIGQATSAAIECSM
jgi:hypothetical protein